MPCVGLWEKRFALIFGVHQIPGVLLDCPFRYSGLMMESDDDYMSCSHCGALLDVNATFCRECGSSHSDGWREEADVGDDDFEDDFDYESFVADEFSTSGVNRQIPVLWRWVAVGLIGLLLVFYAIGLF